MTETTHILNHSWFHNPITVRVVRKHDNSYIAYWDQGSLYWSSSTLEDVLDGITNDILNAYDDLSFFTEHAGHAKRLWNALQEHVSNPTCRTYKKRLISKTDTK